jgi:hypothetical protein
MLDTSSANKNRRPRPKRNEPKFKIGDKVRIPRSTPGHDWHDPATIFTITHAYTGRIPSYQVKGLTSMWSETRLVLVTRSLYQEK